MGKLVYKYRDVYSSFVHIEKFRILKNMFKQTKIFNLQTATHC